MKIFKTAQASNLAIWAGLNIVVGSIFMLQTEGLDFYFHAMNASWNIVNAFVAVFIYFHHNTVFNTTISILKQMDYQRHVEKTIVFNLGLDMAFVATGFALYHFIPLENYPELWVGFGISVMLQGSFLLIQDVVFYVFHRNNRKMIYPHWERMLEKLN